MTQTRGSYKKRDVETPRAYSPKVIKQMVFKSLPGLPQKIVDSFGELPEGFVMMVKGGSGSGKSNLVYGLVKVLSCYGKGSYLSLEEKISRTTQIKVERHFTQDTQMENVQIFDHRMTYEHLMVKLAKKKSAKWVVIDSLQYWRINYLKYQKLREAFPNKIFIFISHTKGKVAKGGVAQDIEYDSDVKVDCTGCVAFVRSRFITDKPPEPYVIDEGAAKKFWKKKYMKW